MLELKQIVKNYPMAEDVVRALKGVDLTFRKNEFVSILGPSGCGKTTLLNIIGGLDRYTSGDLIINGTSTKQYKDKDWDNYRNHNVGFVFQSYNLIPHQTVLENVEIALTLSGISKTERKKRATEVLKKVGLEDKLNTKPNQLSGGQMQRVAIARALVNDPDILLADEPTGALDTTTSVQIMEILQEVSKDRLVIMVTHNPELAEKYSSRIINLLDGEVLADSNPPKDTEISKNKKLVSKGKTSMSFWTALSLSFKNLLTKKTRTALISFAGSIGIIGIALILSLSNGFQAYINRVQADALSNYPVTITSETQNFSAMMDTMGPGELNLESFPDTTQIQSAPILTNMLKTSTLGTVRNDLKSLKNYLENDVEDLDEHINGIQYTYDVDINLFSENDEGVYNQVNTLDLMSYFPGANTLGSSISGYFDVFSEMIDNQQLLNEQYDVLQGRWNSLSNPNEAVLVVSEYNTLTDYTFYNLGLRTNNINFQYYRYLLLNGYLADLQPFAQYTAEYVATMSEEQINAFIEENFNLTPESGPMFNMARAQFVSGAIAATRPFSQYTAEHFNSYKEENGQEALDEYVDGLLANLFNLTYSEDEANETIEISDFIGLTYKVLPTALMYEKEGDVYKLNSPSSDYVQSQLGTNAAIELTIVGVVRVKQGNASGCLSSGVNYSPALTQAIISKTESAPVVVEQRENTTIDVLTGIEFVDGVNATHNLNSFGVVSLESPESISIFPKTFEDKDWIVALIDSYNEGLEEQDQISYTDTLGIMISSMTVILNAITIVLTAFVSTSLVVSSIMIGVITYISVLERIKEIGVLRSVGASKKDISRVFNAETTIIGFAAGVIGIGITLLITIPVNIIVENLTGIIGVATLPWLGGVILGLISILLTFIAGLIPAKLAANKNPVEALRSE